jgi:MYXO-CTERM domain-containing protein
MNKTLLLLTSAFGLSAAGCTAQARAEHILVDDIDLHIDFAASADDGLHSPYVRGTKVHVSGRAAGGSEDSSTWQFFSSDESVLRFDGHKTGGADFTAVGEGAATITAVDANGKLMAGGDITVLVPDRVTLVPHGPMIIGNGTPAAEVRVLVGGSATYLVQYFRAEQKLFGNGVLGANGAGAQLTPQTTFMFENREWLNVKPSVVGTSTIALRADGVSVGAFPLVGVSADSVDDIELVPEQKSGLRAGDNVTVLALARDQSGRSIFGVNVAWDIDGDGKPGVGDLFRYPYAPGRVAVLGAQFGNKRDQRVIAADSKSGTVTRSTHIGCSAAPGPSSGWAASVAVALLGLAAVRRRKS